MNKFQKLAQLNRDIELLENAGKFQAAEVLQRKFVREAQTTFNYPNTGVNYNPAGYAAPGTAYYDPEAPVTNYQTFAQGGTVAPNTLSQPVGVAYSDPEAAVTTFQGLGTAMSQPQGTSGDTANKMQAQNTMPAESPIYQQAINQIAKLLQAKNPMSRTMAQSIYDQTVVQFQDARRKKAFANQFQRLMSTNFPGQSPKS
jgi:hypothetical protein